MTCIACLGSSWTLKIGLAPQVLEAQNHEIVSPSDRSNLHPLVIPLAVQQPSQGQSEPMYTCLLRQATLSNVSEQVYGVSSFKLISNWTHHNTSFKELRNHVCRSCLSFRCHADHAI